MTARVYVEIRCNASGPLYTGSAHVPCSSAIQVEGDRRREAERTAEDLGWTAAGKQGSREHYCKSHTPPG